jgi:hypothetical protein
MKKSLWILSTAAVAAMAAAPLVQAAEIVKVNVPFAFVLADQPLPSGEYRFVREEGSRVVEVYSKAKGHVGVAACMPAASQMPAVGLVFHRHGDQHFLKLVNMRDGLAVSLPTSNAERVAEAAAGRSRAIAVAVP